MVKTNRGVLAKDLLAQIRGDFDPNHFTLSEVKEEYAAVSTPGIGTPVYYDKCLHLLEQDGFIARNRDSSYRICERFYQESSEYADDRETR
jgi:hypothetical protein